MHSRTLQQGFSVRRSAPRGEMEDNSRGDLPDTCAAAGEDAHWKAGGDFWSDIPSDVKPLCRVSLTSAQDWRGKRHMTLAERLAHVCRSLRLGALSYFAALPRLGRSRRASRANELKQKNPQAVFLLHFVPTAFRRSRLRPHRS